MKTSRPSSQPPAKSNEARLCAPARSTAPILEALADLIDGLLGYELRPRVEIGCGDMAINLKVELHDRPESLQERLLAERAGERAGLDLLLLLRAEIEAECTELAVELQLRHR